VSQRHQILTYVGRRQASVCAGQWPVEHLRAMSSDSQMVTGGQGVAGSNPAVPTQVSILIRNPDQSSVPILGTKVAFSLSWRFLTAGQVHWRHPIPG